MGPWAWISLGWLLAGQGQFAAEPVPSSVTFWVLNPKTTGGHRVLHLEDIIGKNRPASMTHLPKPHVMVLLFVAQEGVRARDGGRWADALKGLGEASGSRGMVITVVLASSRGERPGLPADGTRPVVWDRFGIVAHAFGVQGPGEALILGSEGLMERHRLFALGDEAARARFVTRVRQRTQRRLARGWADD